MLFLFLETISDFITYYKTMLYEISETKFQQTKLSVQLD